MLKTLQSQSAQSAGSTEDSTAVSALQVLLVVAFPSFIFSYIVFLVVLQAVLLVCSQLVLRSAVQIHAKLSVCQTCSRTMGQLFHISKCLKMLKSQLTLTFAVRVWHPVSVLGGIYEIYCFHMNCCLWTCIHHLVYFWMFEWNKVNIKS